MTLVGLDLNASRARAVQGPVGDFPRPLSLGEGGDLPVTLSLERSSVEVGRGGEKLRCRAPHLLCHTFLPVLGETRRWKAGRHDLDGFQAMELFWRHLARPLGAGREIVLSLPSYLSRWQADQVRRLGEKAGLKPIGSLPSSLAAALAAYAERDWTSSAIVLDLDEHALSLSRVETAGHQAHVREMHHLPHLGWRVWRERLLNSLADCCVLQTRRDPRDSADAEQALYEQIGLVLDACSQNRLAQLTVGGGNWFQNLVIAPEETLYFCRRLVQQAVQEVQRFLTAVGQPQVVILTQEASWLPGLVKSLRPLFEIAHQAPTSPHGPNRPPSEDDFGINLLQTSGEDRCAMLTLAPLALAQAAHGLAGCFQKGDLPRSHLEQSAPLPLPWPAEVGPARLSFQGRTFHLDGSTFLLGTQPGCQLTVDAAQYPEVGHRHCEIYLDHGTFVLFNRHPLGTWVNDQSVAATCVLHPGDTLRLTPGGPEVLFLGQPHKAAH